MDTRPEPNPRTSWITVAIAVTVAGLLATPLVLLTRGSGARPHRDVAVRKVALDALTDRGLEPSERLERLQRAADDERRVLIEVASWGTDRVRVQQDEHFTRGRLAYVAGDALGALTEAERGLGLGRANSVFVANLHALRGMAREGAGKRAEAVVDYAFAVAVHRSLYEAVAADEGTGGSEATGGE